VVTAGWNGYGQRTVGDWSGIIQVAAGMIHTIGLRSDASVVAAGDNASGQCNVGDWMLT
jgi:alpha-tubulin suppressor-like RCC1 family protein